MFRYSRYLLVVVASLFTLALAPSSVQMAHAELVTFNFTGVVDSVDSALSSQFNTSQTLTGFYTFDSLTPDLDLDPNSGNYAGALTALSVTIGTYTATLGITPFRWITVWNYDSTDAIPFIDAYSVRSDEMNGNPVNGLDPGQFSFYFYDQSHNMISNDDLPLTPPTIPSPRVFISPPGVYSDLWSLGFFDAQSRQDVIGHITSLTPIPEPATMILLGSGLIGLAGYGRKKFFKK